MINAKWQRIYMDDALKKAKRSPDSTKVGAIIVHPDNYEVSNGYNDFPRGVEYNDSRSIRPFKYLYTVHAEQNALMTALFMGVSVKGCWLFTTKYPCADCAKLIVQAGIKKVIFLEGLSDPQWEESATASGNMMREAGIRVEKYVDTTSLQA